MLCILKIVSISSHYFICLVRQKVSTSYSHKLKQSVVNTAVISSDKIFAQKTQMQDGLYLKEWTQMMCLYMRICCSMKEPVSNLM